jgi:glycosyltransferase involved in cell wall biosynthesis
LIQARFTFRDTLMRIGINTLACMPGRSGGDGRYVRELVARLTNIDRDNHYYIFIAPWNEEWFRVSGPRAHRVMCPAPRAFSARVLWEQLFLPMYAARLRLDLFHAPVNVAPLAMPCRVVLTLLEAEPFMFPETIPLPLRLYWQAMRRLSAKRASRILAISNSSKDELVQYMGLRADSIAVTHLGVDLDRFTGSSDPQVTLLPELAGAPYFLWTGRAYPRKNVVRLVEAFGALKRRGLPHRLVLVGVQGWGSSELQTAIEQLGTYRQCVLIPGYLSDATLVALYQHADAFVFPSLHEAFGLPVLEAMACGAPVITSTTTCLPEIVGDAAITVNPTHTREIEEAMYRIATEPGRRAELVERGLRRTRQFTWEQNAREVVALYRATLPAQR